MSRIIGSEAKQEVVLQVAKMAAVAACRAPQTTGCVEVVTEIVTGEDQAPIIEFFETVAPISPVMNFDYLTLKYFYEKKETLPILLIGADITRSELGWDCGACGFEKCGEFNRYSKENRGSGWLMEGPSCVWKMIDFSASCDFACATVAQHRLDCRAMGTVGLAAKSLGFLPGTSVITAIPIGPAGELIYFSRKQNFDAAAEEEHRSPFFRTSPTHWMTFPGGGHPAVKNKQQWWVNPEYAKFEKRSEQENELMQKQKALCAEVCIKHKNKIGSFYDK